MTLKVNCPNCAKEVAWKAENQFRPFCTNRCKLIDLGEWANEEHKISTPMATNEKLSMEDIDALENMLLESENDAFFKE